MAREFNYIVDQPFRLGLRPVARSPRNSNYLTACRGVKAKAEGLVSFTDVTCPISAAELAAHSITISFPFPQLIRGKNVTLLATATQLFLVDETTWTLTELTTYDMFDTATTKAIVSGGPWHFADFYNTFILHNGNCTVVKWGWSDQYFIQDNITITSGTEFRGRYISGGFDPSDYWLAEWQELWHGISPIFESMLDVKKNWFHYSTIGGGDLGYLFSPSLGKVGYLGVGYDDENRPSYVDYWKRNECGLYPLPMQGKVLRTQPLGMSVLLMGEDQIVAMTQASSPIPTFGESRTLKYGIAGRSACAGDDSSCLFLGADGRLRLITADLQVKCLDYSEFLSGAVGANTVITMDDREDGKREFYISGASSSFLYCEDGGLSECPQRLTSGFCDGDTFYGVPISEADQSFLAVTDTLDMQTRALKQLVGVELGGSTSGMKLAYDWKLNPSDSFATSATASFNPQGFAHLVVQGNELRIRISNTSRTGVDVDYIQPKWQHTDKRAIRGPYGVRA